MFTKILIANRGEIACRIMETAQKMGVATVAVYSDADAKARHVMLASEAVRIGVAPVGESYLLGERIIAAALETGAEAVHPGYGFLSENPEFVEAVEAAGLVFIGPSASAIRAMGLKDAAKVLMEEAGVPVVPGYHGDNQDDGFLAARAEEIGYPVLIKAVAGGGGKGMRRVDHSADFIELLHAARREGGASFGNSQVLIEKYILSPRHIEMQVFGDNHGGAVHLFERDCSLQRRHQKVIEEAPSPFLNAETRAAMGAQSVALARAVDYCSAGTVEFIVDSDQNFYFLEMNTRLQVEHPVTELITGIDLVEQMIRVAYGEKLAIAQDDVQLNGWAIESRLYAEDPYRGFLPSIGRLSRYRPPAEEASKTHAVRNDTGVYEGGEISMFYDPMIAKLCSWGPDRAAALETMRQALDGFELEGIGHNLPFCSAVMDHPRFISGDISTAFIEEEYPDGFTGVELPKAILQKLAAGASAMHRVTEIRASRISGRIDNHEREVGTEFVISLGGCDFAVSVDADRDGATVTFADGTSHRVTSDWQPGETLPKLEVSGRSMNVKVDLITNGLRMRHRGADLNVIIRTPRLFELSKHMIEKTAPDTSNLLLCPMPGLVVSVSVAVGDEVQDGQALCTVEAMKMENVLRAEKKAVISKINATAGDSLAVDDVIMEFE